MGSSSHDLLGDVKLVVFLPQRQDENWYVWVQEIFEG